MKKNMLIIIVVLSLLVLASCAKVEEQETGETEEAISDVGLDISDVGSLNKDLDMGELDDIDRDLEDISRGW